jgi:serine phosphatase RsbU (regulator of sigma subunit)
MIVPLEARGRVFGAITFAVSGPDRRYEAADVAFVEDLARRAALAIDNAMLFRREHEAAVTLQRSLLPESLPPAREGIEFDARYRPAAPGLEVGGDWYEVIVADDGSVVVTIGDVAGRGIRAAAVMGRLRPALRAYVLDGHGPGEAVRRLDRLMKEQDSNEMTTLFHLQYDPGSRRAAYVRAGHPPALLRLADGSVVELAGTGTPPLGILDDVEFPEHVVDIPPGSLLLLYTDGLIERRELDLAEALARLKETFAEAPGAAAECLAWLDRQLETDTIPDDVAMLAMSTWM